MSGNIWINEEGNRLVVAGGHVFRASDDPSLDMIYVDTLGEQIRPEWADHSSEAGKWVTLSSGGLTLLADTTYEVSRTIEIDPLFIEPANEDPIIDKAFFSDDGGKLIIIGHSDNLAADNYVVQIIDTPQ